MKILIKLLIAALVLFLGYFAFVYYVPYSEGVRSGKLVKFSKKGVMFKTWEGELSQGVSDAQLFKFSVQDGEKEVIKNLDKYQGSWVKLYYKERYRTFFWMGDTVYFITDVEEDPDKSSYF